VNEASQERPSRPLLLFGGTGQVGRQLLRALAPFGAVVAPSRADADLTKPDTLRALIHRVRPAAVVNAAALTNVDRAEREPDLARAVNDVAPTVMAEASRDVGALIVHYSTDYVFDGAASTPYDEHAEPNPINVYGATKLAGERGVAASDAPHFIIRTSWVYSAEGNGFVATLLRQLNESRPVRVVTDQVGSPTWSQSLADSTAGILRTVATPTDFRVPRDDWGVYHLGGSGEASRFEIAQEVISARAISASAPVVIPTSAAEFNAVAPRPAYSALFNRRAAERFGIRLDNWRVELRRMLASQPT